ADILRRRTMRWTLVVAALLTFRCASRPSTPPEKPATRPSAPSEADEYTRYKLLAPETAQFHILYEVTAIAPGATVFFNPIRKGSEASGERVTDRMTGEPLAFEVVSGQEARRTGLPEADAATDYIRIHLPRPVPGDGGQVRLLIEKTYKDPKSYLRDGDTIFFSRSLGIKRNAVVLPSGYELVSCNVSSQVLSESDGRIAIAFWNPGPEAAPLKLAAKKLAP
ncbi:MAG TPA: hypothetical protein VER78_04985, partial [Thermoanaerobaculia bacterium]|nr:hypothetical protein [Thermoanaerobaculia bacterium]